MKRIRRRKTTPKTRTKKVTLGSGKYTVYGTSKKGVLRTADKIDAVPGVMVYRPRITTRTIKI